MASFLSHVDCALPRARPAKFRCIHNPFLFSRHRALPRHVARAAGNHYDVLGLPQTASIDDIKAAFRKKAKELHPDVNEEEDAEARFKECSVAYEVLVDAQARRDYDQQLARQGQGSMSNFFRDVDFEDDEFIDLDDWRRERRESYGRPREAAPAPEDQEYGEVLEDPAQFLDRLSRFATGLSPSTGSSFWGDSGSSAAWRQRVDEYIQRPRDSRLGRGRNVAQPGEDDEGTDRLEWKRPGRLDEDDTDRLEWKPPGIGQDRDRFGFGKSGGSGWKPPPWKRGT